MPADGAAVKSAGAVRLAFPGHLATPPLSQALQTSPDTVLLSPPSTRKAEEGQEEEEEEEDPTLYVVDGNGEQNAALKAEKPPKSKKGEQFNMYSKAKKGGSPAAADKVGAPTARALQHPPMSLGPEADLSSPPQLTFNCNLQHSSCAAEGGVTRVT